MCPKCNRASSVILDKVEEGKIWLIDTCTVCGWHSPSYCSEYEPTTSEYLALKEELEKKDNHGE